MSKITLASVYTSVRAAGYTMRTVRTNGSASRFDIAKLRSKEIAFSTDKPAEILDFLAGTVTAKAPKAKRVRAPKAPAQVETAPAE